jgi:Uncharacterized conserved protein (some members contain a von Willebrand factor type A (vWA) domain)
VSLPDVLRQVRRLEISSRGLVKNVLAGEYSSVFKGRGVEFADVRPYVPGDDIRTLDWRTTARTGEPYVRRYAEERERTVLFLVDQSASGGFGTEMRTKSELATEVCAVLAFTAVRNNDRVGAAFFSDRVERYVPPARGQRHALRVIRELLTFRPEGTLTDIAAALEFTARVLRRRSIVFILSDWLDSGYEKALEMVARRHDTIAVALTDVRDGAMSAAGLVSLRDPESGAWRYVDSSRAEVREALSRMSGAREAAFERSIRRHGADLISLRTGESYVAPLHAFFRMRERMRGPMRRH